jgi:hypothetical protein
MSHTVLQPSDREAIMDSKTDLANVSAASERFFRLYHAHCVSPDPDTPFSLLEAGHSLSDRLRAVHALFQRERQSFLRAGTLILQAW